MSIKKCCQFRVAEPKRTRQQQLKFGMKITIFSWDFLLLRAFISFFCKMALKTYLANFKSCFNTNVLENEEKKINRKFIRNQIEMSLYIKKKSVYSKF